MKRKNVRFNRKTRLIESVFSSMEERFWSHVRKGDGCWEWTAGRTREGYGKFQISGLRQGWVAAHRVSWSIANPSINPSGRVVRHDCDGNGNGNPSCVRPDHLRIGSQRDNLHDQIRAGTFRAGLLKRMANRRAKREATR